MNDLTQIEETSQEVLTEVSQQPTKKKRKKMTKKRKKNWSSLLFYLLIQYYNSYWLGFSSIPIQ